MRSRFSKLIAIFSVITIVSCDSGQIFDEYQTVPNKWNKDDLKTFKFSAPDTTNYYNLFINIRNNNDYKFNNLFLIAEMNYPNGRTITDTLEYRMANAEGELLGEGFSDLKENKLWLKGHEVPFIFSENGDYVINIQHAVRENGKVQGEDYLEGITDIGFRIEQAEQ